LEDEDDDMMDQGGMAMDHDDSVMQDAEDSYDKREPQLDEDEEPWQNDGTALMKVEGEHPKSEVIL
jgi:hypothetical protein